jgi:phage-related tail fiber protein
MPDTPKLQGIWTQYGLATLASLLPGDGPMVIAYAALGDGAGSLPIVLPSQTELVNEVWRGPVNGVIINPDDPTDVIVEAVVPNNVGGFFVREWGLSDDKGNLIAVGPHDEMHKPLITDGQAAEFLERFHLPVSNTAAIYLSLPTQSLASVAYVDAEITKHNGSPDAHQGAPAVYALMLSHGDLIVSKATGDDALDLSGGYQSAAILPAKTTYSLNTDRELIMQLPA